MSTISASTTSTTAYKVTADTTGTLVLQTGSSPTTAVTIDSSQNVGIGTSSPSYKLDVSGETMRVGNSTAYAGLQFGANATATNNFHLASNTGALIFYNGNYGAGTERMRIDSSGNVGIGTSSPRAKFDVNGASVLADSDYGYGVIELGKYGTGDRYSYIDFHSSGTPGAIDFSARLIRETGANGNLALTNSGTGALILSTNSAERARIDSSGNLLVGTTSNVSGNWLSQFVTSTSGAWPLSTKGTDRGMVIRCTAASGIAMYFETNNGGSVSGSINVSGTTTTYSTSSDYRLKENIQPMQNALATVAQLKPCTYKWKADGSEGQGFIAHELQAVVPDCVTGEKDAVDADGNPVYQGIDTSFLVATLTAAIQELKAELDAAKADIATLKGAA